MNYKDTLEQMGVSIGDYVSDKDFLIHCPFHADANPSCEVDENRGVFFCFGCKSGGDFTKLYAKLKGIRYGQAKIELEDDTSPDEMLDSMLRLLNVPDEIIDEKAMFSITSFRQKFPAVNEIQVARLYLGKRKISLDIAKKFDLRFGVEGVMKDRIVLPIFTEQGQLWSYAGRTVIKGHEPKTRKVRKRSCSHVLYGLWELHKAKKGKFPYLIIVEGEFDAMYLQSFGLYAVSTMGSNKFSVDQQILVHKFTNIVVWSYDSDLAGKKAQKSGSIVTKALLPTHEIELPSGKDPNDLTPGEVKKIYRRYL